MMVVCIVIGLKLYAWYAHLIPTDFSGILDWDRARDGKYLFTDFY